MQTRPLLVLAALAAAADPDLARGAIERLEGKLRERYVSDPMGSTVAAVLLASFLFHRAERGHNPKVRTLQDALLYVGTSLSGGARDVSPVTTAGKTIGAAMATFGPAMARRILDEPRAAAGSDLLARAVVERLDRVLAVLGDQG